MNDGGGKNAPHDPGDEQPRNRPERDEESSPETGRPRPWTRQEMEEAEPLPLPELPDEDEDEEDHQERGEK
jgi:hypothetical protein